MMLKKFAARAILAAGVASLALSFPVAAQESPAGGIAEGTEQIPEALPPPDDYGMKEFDPFAGLEKFALKKPLVELPTPDPARLAVADKILAKLMADGTYVRVMSVVQKDTLQPLLDRVWTMKASEFASLFGFAPEEMPKERADETFADAMMKNDPYGKQRIEAFMTTYFQLMGEAAGAIEPDLRGAMARDFARRYDLAQLQEMDRFFSTPAGMAFAKDYMTSSFTLDVLQTSLMVFPKMIKKVPDFATRLAKADAALPPRPRSASSSPDMTPECAKDGDEADCTPEDWATAYDDHQAAERDAWSKKDRSAVEKAEAKRDKEQDALTAQYKKLDMAEATLSDLIYAARKNAGQDTYPTAPPIMVMPTPVPVMAPPAPAPQE